MLPKPVNDLCSGLDLYTFATWEFVFIHFGVVPLHPDVLATLQDLLLLVDDIVVRMLVGGSWGGDDHIYTHIYCGIIWRKRERKGYYYYATLLLYWANYYHATTE